MMPGTFLEPGCREPADPTLPERVLDDALIRITHHDDHLPAPTFPCPSRKIRQPRA